MSEDYKNLLGKLNDAISENATTESATDFFGSLNLNEFNWLVEIFENNEFPGREDRLRKVLLVFLKNLRSKLIIETGEQ